MIALDEFKNTMSLPFKFKGRSSRAQYWYSSFLFIFSLFALLIIARILSYFASGLILDIYSIIFGMWWIIYIFIYGIPLEIRRLHDLDMSGWNYFWRLFPIFGELFLLYSYTKPGTVGNNRFGPDPLFPVLSEDPVETK